MHGVYSPLIVYLWMKRKEKWMKMRDVRSRLMQRVYPLVETFELSNTIQYSVINALTLFALINVFQGRTVPIPITMTVV